MAIEAVCNRVVYEITCDAMWESPAGCVGRQGLFDGCYSTAFDECAEVAQKKGWKKMWHGGRMIWACPNHVKAREEQPCS